MQGLASLATCSPPCTGCCSAVVEGEANRQRQEMQLRRETAGVLWEFGGYMRLTGTFQS